MINNAISVTEDGIISILNDEDEIKIFKDINRPIIYYTHDSCEFITVYDINHDLKSIVIFDNVEPLHDLIDHLYDWIPIFNSTDDGVIDLSTNGIDLSIHYKWISYDDVKYLTVYGINQTYQNLFNIFNVTGYIAIILSFTILSTLIYQRHYRIANKYKELNNEIQKML
jgi:hypothetical protein